MASTMRFLLCWSAILVLLACHVTALGVRGGRTKRSAKVETAYILKLTNQKEAHQDTATSFVGRVSNVVHRIYRRATADAPEIKSFEVLTKVSSRFSRSVIISEMYNPSKENKDATFEVQIPSTAFMSNFTMLVNGKLTVAEVKSKEEARKEYEDAKKENKTAGLVENNNRPNNQPPQNVREMDRFIVTVTVKGESAVVFELTYQELLIRRQGMYELTTSVRLDHAVDKLKVFVAIYEPKGIRFLDIDEPGSQNSVIPEDSTVTDVSNTVKEIVYSPTKDKQQQQKGTINGDFIVRYDVEHTNDAGDIEADGGYFVHFFSPDHSSYTPLSKNVIFVIDISGSMGGDKIAQTRDSLLAILPQLRSNDKFMFILFDDQLEYWPRSEELVAASASNIVAGQDYVKENVQASGGTNIEMAVTTACMKLRSYSDLAGANLIVFLTDGMPSAGITDTPTILKNVQQAANNKVTLLSLGFGFSLDFDLLQSMSYRNNGFARRIYTGVDAKLQLNDFFLEVNTPLMYDVKMTYPPAAVNVDTLSQSGFAQYFNGTELVVVGELQQQAPTSWDMSVTCVVIDNVELKKTISTIPPTVPPTAANIYEPGMPKKLYIYWKIKDLLRRMLMTDSTTEQDQLEEFALRLALEYNLVTPLTSFVVVHQEEKYNNRDVLMSAGKGFGGAASISHLGIPLYLTITFLFYATIYIK